MSKANAEEAIFEQLTNKAMAAAIQGKWDSVAHFYERRAHTGSLKTISRDLARKLIPIDRWIITRIREVQTLTQQQLEEAQQHRRQLEGLKRQWVSQPPFQASHRLSI